MPKGGLYMSYPLKFANKLHRLTGKVLSVVTILRFSLEFAGFAVKIAINS
jgi:hypothetical protein